MAADLGVGAVDINVAITAYLVTIAVGIPVSGWLTDRFGGRRILLVGHRDVHGGLRPLRRQRQLGDARRRARPAGCRRRDDGAGGPTRRAARHREAGSARCHGLPHLAGAARSGAGAGPGWLDRVGRQLAMDLLDQCPARDSGVRRRQPDCAPGDGAVGRTVGLGRVPPLCRISVVPAGRDRTRRRLLICGPDWHRRNHRRRSGSGGCQLAVAAADRPPPAAFRTATQAVLPGGERRRVGVPNGDQRRPIPAPVDVPGRLRLEPGPRRRIGAVAVRRQPRPSNPRPAR